MIGSTGEGTAGRLARRELADGSVIQRSPLLEALHIPHAFTTRRSVRGRADLDASEMDTSARERVFLVAGISPHAYLVRAQQIHGDSVAVVEDATDATLVPVADALVTSRPDCALLVFTADCVPILLARADGGRVAAVHAGWRGLVAGVILRALEHMGEGQLVAAIGPCLSLERFEVGPEVVEPFRAAGLDSCIDARFGARPHIDLRHAARLQLERAGVARIDVSDRCTWNDPELWSHRRDVTHGGRARTGRLGALIALRTTPRAQR
jgi:YfiH family protein